MIRVVTTNSLHCLLHTTAILFFSVQSFETINLTSMQEVRNFLKHGPIKVAGDTYPNLTMYYLALTKALQVGHASNLAGAEVNRLIQSPGVALAHQLLNSANGAVCDIVHWALCDLASKITHPDKQVCTVIGCFCP
jgi:hypothetical protein